MSSIDNNREQLKNVEAYTRILNMSHLITPINEDDVPMYSTTELKSVEVDTSSPQNSEKLVDMSLYGIKTLAYYKEEAHNNPTYNSDISGAPDIIYAREGVCEKLKNVNEDLSPLGLEIIVYDAHRSPATQKRLYMHFVKNEYGLFPKAGGRLQVNNRFYCELNSTEVLLPTFLSRKVRLQYVTVSHNHHLGEVFSFGDGASVENVAGKELLDRYGKSLDQRNFDSLSFG